MRMLRGLRPKVANAWFKLAGHGVNGRDLDVFNDDVWLVGYPKSGNTWLNFLMASLLASRCDDVDYVTIEQWVADIYYNNARKLHKLEHPRHLKSHESYDPRYGKVIYIVRDPRDVVVSYYYHQIKLYMLESEISLSEFVTHFVSGEVDTLGGWGDHIKGWLEHRNDIDFLLVRYEDLKSDAFMEMKRILDFLQLEITDDRIADAIAWCSPENMRRLEQLQQEQHPSMKKARKDIPFIRKAVAGGWKSELTEKDVLAIVNQWGDVMNEIGYES